MYCIFHEVSLVVQRWDLEETRQPRGQLRARITRDPNKQEEYAGEGKWPNCFVFVSAGPLWVDVFLWVVTYCARLVLYGWVAVGNVRQRDFLCFSTFHYHLRENFKGRRSENSQLFKTVSVHFPFAPSFLLAPRPLVFSLRPLSTVYTSCMDTLFRAIQ